MGWIPSNPSHCRFYILNEWPCEVHGRGTKGSDFWPGHPLCPFSCLQESVPRAPPWSRQGSKTQASGRNTKHQIPRATGLASGMRKWAWGSQSPWATEVFARNIETDPLSGWTWTPGDEEPQVTTILPCPWAQSSELVSQFQWGAEHSLTGNYRVLWKPFQVNNEPEDSTKLIICSPTLWNPLSQGQAAEQFEEALSQSSYGTFAAPSPSNHLPVSLMVPEV